MISLLSRTGLLILVILWTSSAVRPQVTFTRHNIVGNFNSTMSIYAVDVDSDGDNDVLGASYGSNTIAWFENDGSQNFTQHIIDSNFGGARVVHADDIDGDQDIDIIGTAGTANKVSVWENDGNQNFDEHILSNAFVGAHTVYTEDVDGDGDKDILASAWSMIGISWWENTGNWGFEEHIITQGGSDYPCVYATDIDSDHDIDVLAAICQNGRINWWENNGNQQFMEHIVSGNFAGAHWVYAADIDNDTDIDILGAAYGANRICWWMNDGSQGFIEIPLCNDFIGATSVYAEDVDGDGDLDILGAAEEIDQIRWFENDGAGDFDQHIVTDDFNGASHVYAIDLDEDGDTDILGAARFGDELAWWANNTYQFAFETSVRTGHAPLSVDFIDQSYADWEITQWSWDFNNDGSIDSYLQNPSWIYPDPGDYSVRLVLSDGTHTKEVLYQDYIHVFDGFSALEFDGQDSYGSCPASESINLTGELTIEAWIRPFGWGENTGMGLGKIVEKEKYSVFLIEASPVFNDSSLIFQIRDSSGHTVMINSESNSITTGQWQHIAATYDDLAAVQIYINGVEQELYQTGQLSGGIENNLAYDILIGNTYTGNKTFDGILDEIRIWNYARPLIDIEASMNRRLIGNEDGLMAYWQMDEGSGTTIYDGSGNGNDAAVFDINWVQGKQLEPTVIDDFPVENQPSKMAISKAYPNPFNGTLVIAFDIRGESPVTLDIYDILGRKVETIFDGFLNSRSQRCTWNASSYPTGIYFYKLDVGGRSEKKKILLLK